MTATSAADVPSVCAGERSTTVEERSLEAYAAAANDVARRVDGRLLMPPLYAMCLAFPQVVTAVEQALGGAPFPPVVHMPQLSHGTAMGPDEALAAGYSPDNDAPPIAP